VRTRRCKGALTRWLRRPGQVVVAFGDGGRDLCMARAADLVFARGRLLELCRQEGLPAVELTDFDAATVELAARLGSGGRGAPGPAPPAGAARFDKLSVRRVRLRGSGAPPV